MAAALIVPLSFIMTTTAMTDHVVYACNVIKTVEDNHGQLNFVSTILTTTTNASSSFGGETATSNSTMTEMPHTSMDPAIPEKGYLVEEIRDNLYLVTDGSYNTIFLVTDEGVVAVDAPPSIGQTI